MKRRVAVFSFLVTAIFVLATESPANINAKIEIDYATATTMGGGKVSIPISVRDVSTLRVCHIVMRYKGNLTSADFIPSDYLHEAIVVQPKVNRLNKTILFAVAATNKVITRASAGVVGNLIITGNVQVGTLEISEAVLLDEDFKTDTVVLDSQALTAEAPGEAPSSVLKTELFQSYPNPANPTTTISFSLEETSRVSLTIYDVRGKLVQTLVDESLAPDTYEFVWDARDSAGVTVASGIYFYRLEAGSYRVTKKMVLLK